MKREQPLSEELVSESGQEAAKSAEVEPEPEQQAEVLEKSKPEVSEIDEGEKQRLIREQAMAESRSYFEGQSAEVMGNLEGKQQAIKELLSAIQGEENISVDQITQKLGVEGGAEMMALKALEDCKPVENVDQAAALFLKRMSEQLDPGAQLVEASQLFDAGQSWYHTTGEGQARLAEINADVTARLQAELESEMAAEAEEVE